MVDFQKTAWRDVAYFAPPNAALLDLAQGWVDARARPLIGACFQASSCSFSLISQPLDPSNVSVGEKESILMVEECQ